MRELVRQDVPLSWLSRDVEPKLPISGAVKGTVGQAPRMPDSPSWRYGGFLPEQGK